MANTRPILYSFRRCPYAMRARMAIAASGIQVELREVVLRAKPACMLELSPKGTVPVLALPGGDVIDESLDIMLWALAQADPAGWLQPDLGSYDEMLALISTCDADFKHQLDRYKYANRYEGAVAEDHRSAAEAYLAVLEARLADTIHLCGAAPSLADYAVMPFIRQFANVDINWFAAAPYPHVQHWLSGMLEGQIFTGIMGKYPQWQAGDIPLVFPA